MADLSADFDEGNLIDIESKVYTTMIINSMFARLGTDYEIRNHRDFGGNGKSTLTTPTDACQIMCSNAHLPHTAPPALRYPAPIFYFLAGNAEG